jgi:stearoyl-CoA desaturase (delta-9 desaturase)
VAHHFYDASDWLFKDESKLAEAERVKLEELISHNKSLRIYIEMRRELIALWERSHASREQLLQQLQDWCTRAEQSGIKSLRDFSVRLRRYV